MIFIFVSMISMAMMENVRGVFIPIFKSQFNINDIGIGYMLTVSSIGYIFATYIGGSLCSKVGQKKVMILGFCEIILSLIILGFTYNYATLLIAMFIFEVGLAMLSIAINTIIPLIFLTGQGIIMNLTHFCYGLGSSGAQRAAGKLLQDGMDFRYIYLFGAFLISIVFILFFFLKIPLVKPNSLKGINKKAIFKNKLIYIYILALGFYVFCEMGTSNWFVNLMENSYGFSKNRSAIYLSLFFAIFTIGRLLGGFVVEKFGYLRSITYAILMAFILYTLGVMLKEQGVLLISISGLFLSITFPTMLTSVSKVFKELGAYATGIVVTGASSINMILNIVVGYFNEYMKRILQSETRGIYYAYYLLPLCIFITLLFCFALYLEEKRKDKPLEI